ncbi:GPI biosynthesis protein Pig-F [Phlyctochytrium arcticum]|nr:GPI biosynthesis protein Pig-F [Phlyctochytrium arcticum]
MATSTYYVGLAAVLGLVSYLSLWTVPHPSILASPSDAIPKAIVLQLISHIILAILGVWDVTPDPLDSLKHRGKKSKAVEPGSQWQAAIGYGLWWTLAGTVAIWTLAVLFGAPLFSLVGSTWLASAYIATLVFFPAGALLRSNAEGWVRVLSCQRSPENAMERLIYYSLVASFIGAWFGGFGIPLDWQRDWQTWPIPIIYGSFLGNLAGLGLFAASSLMQ